MKKNVRGTNALAAVFNWVGESFEKLTPAAFKFLSAVLPYVTPFPVAWLTSKSASEYLEFTQEVSFIFVFGLEGIGLWFTSLLVDSVVEAIKSKNKNGWYLVILFTVVVAVYIVILVNLNVRLEISSGHSVNPNLSTVITLLCFLPLITGIGNGYYRIRLDNRTRQEDSEYYNRDLGERLRQEKRDDARRERDARRAQELEILKITHGLNNSIAELEETGSGNGTKIGTGSRNGSRSGTKEEVWNYLELKLEQTGTVGSFSEVVMEFRIPAASASRYRKEWMKSKGII